MAIAHEPIIQLMNNVKAPYNINKLTADIASRALDDFTLYKNNIKTILNERDYLINELKSISAVEKIYPTDANFILFRISRAQEIYKTMADRGVVCRYRGMEPNCDECLRVTVGTKEENKKFIELLKKVATEKGIF
jgi:histidinol-phosphate aminotransferase